jgi:hypothetical protein
MPASAKLDDYNLEMPSVCITYVRVGDVVADLCFFSGSAGSDGILLTHSSHVDATLVMSSTLSGQ